MFIILFIKATLLCYHIMLLLYVIKYLRIPKLENKFRDWIFQNSKITAFINYKLDLNRFADMLYKSGPEKADPIPKSTE